MTSESDSDSNETLDEALLQSLEQFDESLRSGLDTSIAHPSPDQDHALPAEIRRCLEALDSAIPRSRRTLTQAISPRSPESIGRFEIEGVLGAGGFAVVYLARDRSHGRQVAIKIPRPHALISSELRERFVREAQAAAQLQHPHIVSTYEAAEDGALPYIAYAFCSGPTLAGWLKQNPGTVPADVCADLVAKLANAVHYSHERGILHRDIKPANVLLFPEDDISGEVFPFVPKLSDFGLAKLVESSLEETGSSLVLGTPLYMAPEQAERHHRTLGPPTDVYGLGVILYELLTGRPPFTGRTVVEVLDSLRSSRYVPIRQLRPDVPRPLQVICDKALARRAEDRFSSAAELEADLLRFLQRQPIQARPIHPVNRLLRHAQGTGTVRVAADYTIICNLIVLSWVQVWPIFAFLGKASTRGVEFRDILPYSVPITCFHLVNIWLGTRVARRQYWAAVGSGLCAFAISLLQFAVVAAWVPPPFPTVYADVRTRDIVYTLLFCLFSTQTILCLFASLALRGKRN